jgi:hypothetical protein
MKNVLKESHNSSSAKAAGLYSTSHSKRFESLFMNYRKAQTKNSWLKKAGYKILFTSRSAIHALSLQYKIALTISFTAKSF